MLGGGKVQAFNRVTVTASAERFRQSIPKMSKSTNVLIQTAKCISQSRVGWGYDLLKGSDTVHTAKSEKDSNSSSKSESSDKS